MLKTEDDAIALRRSDPDQQPIQRVIGRRIPPPAGQFPSAAVRAAMDDNLRYRTRVPKGIFRYESHEEMTQDREKWTTEAMLARQRDRD
jgi:hypothetical protein